MLARTMTQAHVAHGHNFEVTSTYHVGWNNERRHWSFVVWQKPIKVVLTTDLRC